MNSLPCKAESGDRAGRFREVISDPLNLLIERVPLAGVVEAGEVYLHNGNRVPVAGPGSYYDEFSQLLIFNRGVHEPLEEYVFQEVLKSMPAAPLMIELGAYWAHYSMWLQKVRPDSKVFMIEPERVNLEAGQRNFARNGFIGEFLLDSVAPPRWNKRDRWKLDTFLEARAIAHVNILHADIQGMESEMIAGGSATFGRLAVDYVFVSTHSQELHLRVLAELSRYGYRTEVASDFDNETTSHDGFVFASSPASKAIFRDFNPLGRTAIANSHPSILIQTILKVRASTI